MTASQELAVQPSLSAELFNRFLNLKVGMSLSGSVNYELEDLNKVLAGERLERGRELVVTARFFVSDISMPVKRSASYYGEESYELADAKLHLKLVRVEGIDVGESKMAQVMAKPCDCLIPVTQELADEIEANGYQHKYARCKFPLDGMVAERKCEKCLGRGYIKAKASRAPYADEPYGGFNPTLVLVDELPDPPPLPEGACELCGRTDGRHTFRCPNDERNKQQAEVIKTPPAEGDQDPERPDCFGEVLLAEEDPEDYPFCTEECAHRQACREEAEAQE